MAVAIAVREVTYGYRRSEPVIENISFSIEEGQFLTIMGPNGAGKTTLLRAILGLVRPWRGEVRVFGEIPWANAEKVRARVAYVPQREHVRAHIPLSVLEVALMDRLSRRRPPRTPTAQDLNLARDVLRELGLEELESRPFRELSVGQQQRVLLARALLTEADILLLDEPLAAIDPASRTVLLNAICHQKEERRTVVLVTHDVNPVLEVSDYVLLLNRKMVAFGPPSDVIRSETLQRVYGRGALVVIHEGRRYAVIHDIICVPVKRA